jgi:hypothetical protein
LRDGTIKVGEDQLNLTFIMVTTLWSQHCSTLHKRKYWLLSSRSIFGSFDTLFSTIGHQAHISSFSLIHSSISITLQAIDRRAL